MSIQINGTTGISGVDGTAGSPALQGVLPEAVDTTDPDSLGLDYGAVIPLLVAALKESKERIESLEAKVAALEGGAS